MMGMQRRLFGPLDHVSLAELVPQDHFYRHVDRTLDLSFVRDLVKAAMRPLDDPKVSEFQAQLGHSSLAMTVRYLAALSQADNAYVDAIGGHRSTGSDKSLFRPGWAFVLGNSCFLDSRRVSAGARRYWLYCL